MGWVPSHDWVLSRDNPLLWYLMFATDSEATSTPGVRGFRGSGREVLDFKGRWGVLGWGNTSGCLAMTSRCFFSGSGQSTAPSELSKRWMAGGCGLCCVYHGWWRLLEPRRSRGSLDLPRPWWVLCMIRTLECFDAFLQYKDRLEGGVVLRILSQLWWILYLQWPRDMFGPIRINRKLLPL